MGLAEQRISENKNNLKMMPERISNVEMKTSQGDFTVDVIKKQIKNSNDQIKDVLVAHHPEEFPESQNKIRIYLPLMGAAGHVPTEDEIRQLFRGESVKINCVSVKTDKPYSPTMTFSPLAEHYYNGKLLDWYGDMKADFNN